MFKKIDKFEVILRAAEAPEFGLRKVFETKAEYEKWYYDNFRNCRGRKFEIKSIEGYAVTEELFVCQEFHYHMTVIDRSGTAL